MTFDGFVEEWEKAKSGKSYKTWLEDEIFELRKTARTVFDLFHTND